MFFVWGVLRLCVVVLAVVAFGYFRLFSVISAKKRANSVQIFIPLRGNKHNGNGKYTNNS